MSDAHILVVEDEESILELLTFNLVKAGFKVTPVETGEAAVDVARNQVDLILLDIMLPGADGLDILRRLKDAPATAAIPVVMVTAKSEESDIVTGLEIGADDYIPKPFSPKELIARVKAVLRRAQLHPPNEEEVLTVHGITIHPGRHEVRIDGEKIDLTRTEFRLLHFLARRPGWVYTRYQIVDAIHGEDYPVTDRSVDVQVAGLRKKLGKYDDVVETVRGVGYRFKE